MLIPYIREWISRPVIACCALCLFAMVTSSGVAQFEAEEVYDPFGPPPREVGSVVNHLRGVKHELTLSDSMTSVVGMTFVQPRESEGKRQITFQDFAALPELSRLRTLRFGGNIIEDDWLPAIAKYKGLEELMIRNSSITSEGLQALARLNLKRANFGGCRKLDDKAMETIADWEKLQFLELSNVPLTDEGIHILRGLVHLEELDLSYAREEDGRGITNASVDVLKTFTKLRELDIIGTAINTQGLAELEKALPDCRIACLPTGR